MLGHGVKNTGVDTAAILATGLTDSKRRKRAGSRHCCVFRAVAACWVSAYCKVYIRSLDEKTTDMSDKKYDKGNGARCGAISCKNSKEKQPEMSFHRFPRDPER